MLSVIASAILVFSLFVPFAAHAETNASESPRKINDVKASESIERYKKAREQSQKQREEALRKLQARKDEAEAKRQKTREEFRRKLAQVTDKRKQGILENLDERISNVNEKWVEIWTGILNRLSAIVAKIDERSEGSVDTSDAKTAISTAQNAVNTQAAKTYQIEIGEEETLGENARATIQEFHEDLRKVHAQVKTAREEVVKVLRELKEKNEE